MRSLAQLAREETSLVGSVAFGVWLWQILTASQEKDLGFAAECEERLKSFWEEATLRNYSKLAPSTEIRHATGEPLMEICQAASKMLEAVQDDGSLTGDAFLELYSGEGGTDAMDWYLA